MLLIKPIVFLTFPLPSSSRFRKVPGTKDRELLFEFSPLETRGKTGKVNLRKDLGAIY